MNTVDKCHWDITWHVTHQFSQRDSTSRVETFTNIFLIFSFKWIIHSFLCLHGYESHHHPFSWPFWPFSQLWKEEKREKKERRAQLNILGTGTRELTAHILPTSFNSFYHHLLFFFLFLSCYGPSNYQN